MDKNQIFITSGTEYKRMTKELLEKADLQSHIGDRKKKIGIKPNLVSPSEASWGATTHPEVVAGIIEYLKEHGFRDMVMLEGSWVGDKTREAFETCGFDRLEEEYQVPFWDMQKDKGISVDCGGMELNVCERVKELGYKPGVYASTTWYRKRVDYNTLRSRYTIWNAHYGVSSSPIGCDLWQGTEKARINGYSGELDANISYIG